ncbi:hypothetical protein EDF62_3232 [Leucobacter luti]|uniref:Uncharacterized protein n=1 Tax=Leucobacter luti TaxID=340320 RepID=A0A4R6RRN9_9MICO|nr:hypothetical protein [Leucobacter luti]TDP89501.1 hypothetical protein EDF62_3232 [Leucobacter luti]
MDDNKPFEFSAEQRSEILRTALTVEAAQKSLPVESQENLDQIIERVGFLLSPGSMAVAGPLSRVESRYKNVKQWKHIKGTLIHVDRETTSGRAILVIATEPTKDYPLGQEIVRTNSTEWDDIAKNLARTAARRIGENVLLRVAIENTGNARKPTVRVLHDISFRGADTRLFDQNGNYVPQQVRWDALGPMNGQFDTSKLATFQPR